MTWISDFLRPEESSTRLTTTFEPAGEGRRRIVLVHDELPETDAYGGHEQGWADILDKLALPALSALAGSSDDAAFGGELHSPSTIS
ncbi:MAG: hypothetical protein E4H03_01450 [Myxococcales bacterium]|jgi:uncharacterized protein YndB with AHSA1/START domain|nr:MAG: hypothetical protein E4H03_01450 [Myxococcales bacterium]